MLSNISSSLLRGYNWTSSASFLYSFSITVNVALNALNSGVSSNDTIVSLSWPDMEIVSLPLRNASRLHTPRHGAEVSVDDNFCRDNFVLSVLSNPSLKCHGLFCAN